VVRDESVHVVPGEVVARRLLLVIHRFLVVARLILVSRRC
jgi:hypothetical protein